MNGNSQQFSIYLQGVSAGEADITRDGEWMTYVSHPDLTLWRSKPDGSSRTQLTYAPNAGAHAALVARWNSDRVHGIAPGEALEDIRDTSRGWHAA